MQFVRICLFLLLFGLWFWASSIFAPWVTSTDPKLWLYDLLFYTRFVLLFWAVFELLYAWLQIRSHSGLRRYGIISMSAIGIAALTISAYIYLMHTGSGFRYRMQMSSNAMAEFRQPVFANHRQRAGWFLIDTQRQPCDDEAWLWLGEAYGGGTGNNLALVYSKNAVPQTPIVEAFRFWPVSDQWWLAFQNPGSYHSRLDEASSCTEGKTVNTHEQGMQFIGATASD